MQGHLIAAKKFQDSIFPFLSGWNSQHFAGFPQGYLYPSFFHWLIGGFAKITSIEFSFSFWVAISVLLTPLSWIYLSRNHELDDKKIKTAILLQTLLYFAPKNSMGGDAFGTFFIGLVNQQWAMPFFYFYLGTIVKIQERKNWILAGLFLGIICLSHAFVLFASILASFAYLIASKDFLKLARFSAWLKMIILSLMIGAAWWLPFLKYREWGSGIGIPFSVSSQLWGHQKWGILLIMGIVILIISILIFNHKNKSFQIKTNFSKGPRSFIFLTFSFIGLIGFLDFFTPFPLLEYFPLHLYRLQFFLLSIFLFFLSFRDFSRLNRILLLLLTLCSCFYGVTFSRISDRIKISIDLKSNPDSRVLVYQGSEKFFKFNLPHILADTVSLTKSSTINGLFVESSKHSSFYMSLLFGLFKKPFVWGVKVPPFNSLLATEQLNSLGINTIVSKSPLSDEQRLFLPLTESFENVQAEVILNGKKISDNLHIYKMDFNYAESLSDVTFIKKNWEDEIFHWWTSITRIKSTLIKIEESSPLEPIGSEKNNKINVERNPNSDESFKVHAGTHRKWIKIKESYSPQWKAFSQNKELPIYLCSPFMMCIYGEGLIEFKFTRGMSDYLGCLLSFLGFLFCLISYTHKKIFLLFLILPLSSCHYFEKDQLDQSSIIPTSIASGSYHSCFIHNFNVLCSGYNNFSQLGYHSFKGASKPIKAINHLSKPLGLSLGAFHTCVWNSKDVECVGDNFDQQFGFKSEKSFFSKFKSVLSDFEIKHEEILDVQSFGGNICILARDSMGSFLLHCAGRIWRNTGYKFRLTSESPLESLSVGEDHLCYVQKDQVFCSGSSKHGATTHRSDLNEKFLPVEGIDSKIYLASKVSAGAVHTCGLFFNVIKKKDTIFCWGDNSRSQVSKGNHSSPNIFYTPKEVEPLQNFITDRVSVIRSGYSNSCAIINQRLFCWGSNIEYGTPVVHEIKSSAPPIKEISLGSIKDISLGVLSTCALLDNNYVCFGTQVL
jgi:hypothetical protein